jgi:hypothetical protein
MAILDSTADTDASAWDDNPLYRSDRDSSLRSE